MLRKSMAIFAEHDHHTEDETISMIVREINRKPETVRELLLAGKRNMGCVDFYRQYSNDNGKKSEKDVLVPVPPF